MTSNFVIKGSIPRRVGVGLSIRKQGLPSSILPLVKIQELFAALVICSTITSRARLYMYLRAEGPVESVSNVRISMRNDEWVHL